MRGEPTGEALSHIYEPGGTINLSILGVLVDNAMALVASPPWSSAQMEGYLEKAFDDILKVGLTNVHDAASLPEYIEVFSQCVPI